jgi:phytoene desaturase
LVPIASGLEYTEEQLKQKTEKILDTLSECMNIPELRARIVYQTSFCVKDFTERYNSFQGTALGLAHTLKQTATFRPNNINPKVKNLYYVGANTNPGIGMPICLISAELVVKRLMGDKSGEPLSSL